MKCQPISPREMICSHFISVVKMEACRHLNRVGPAISDHRFEHFGRSAVHPENIFQPCFGVPDPHLATRVVGQELDSRKIFELQRKLNLCPQEVQDLSVMDLGIVSEIHGATIQGHNMKPRIFPRLHDETFVMLNHIEEAIAISACAEDARLQELFLELSEYSGFFRGVEEA